MKPEPPSQAEGRVQVPSLRARAKGAAYINRISISITYGSPDPGLLEVVEESPKQHVIPLLLNVDAPWPVTQVETIPSKPAC